DAWKDCKGAPQPPDDKFKRLAPEGPFDGGRAVVSCPMRRNFCMGEYPVASCVVHCTEDGVVPSMNSQKIKATVALAKQVEGGPQPFQNQLDPKYADQRPLLSMCYECHGDRVHGDRSYYLKPTDTGRAKLSSEWHNQRKTFYGRSKKTEDNICDYLISKAEQRVAPELAPTLREAYVLMWQIR
ncbi:unnamed protein product, partial [Prorocentrum cordatum]